METWRQGTGNDVKDWMVANRWQWGEQKQRKTKREDVSWSNIHITNEFREGLLVEVFIQHPGQTSAPWTEQREGRKEERQQWKRGGNTSRTGRRSISKGSRSLTFKWNIQEAKDSDRLISISWVSFLKQLTACTFLTHFIWIFWLNVSVQVDIVTYSSVYVKWPNNRHRRLVLKSRTSFGHKINIKKLL